MWSPGELLEAPDKVCQRMFREQEQPVGPRQGSEPPSFPVCSGGAVSSGNTGDRAENPFMAALTQKGAGLGDKLVFLCPVLGTRNS